MRSKKIFLNISASLLLQLIVVIAGFILPRMYIQNFGSDVNGMISSIKQFLIYLSLVEGGIAAAAIAALYKPIAEKKIHEINSILSTTKDFYRKLGWFFLGLVIVIGVLYGILIIKEISFSISFTLVIILGFSAFIEYFIMGKYRVILTAHQKNYILSIIQIQATVLNTLIIVILIYLNVGILWIQVAATLVYILRVIFVKKYIKKNYSFISFKEVPDSKAVNQRWDALIHQFASLIVFNSPIIILTIFTNLTEVSIYSIYLIVFSGIQMFISAFTNGIVASFGDLLTSNNKSVLRKTFEEFEFLYYIILFVIYSCAFVLVLPFIKIYTEGFTDGDYYRPVLATLFVLVGIANNIRIPTNILVTSAGHFKETKNRALIEAFINIVASILFTIYFGMIGVLLGGLLSYSYRTLDFIYYTYKNILHQSPFKTLRKISFNITLCIGTIYLIDNILMIKSNNFLEWAGYALITALISMVIIISCNSLIYKKSAIALYSRLCNLIRSFRRKKYYNSHFK